MCSLCRLPVAKKHNFGQILNFGGLLYRLPFTDKAQIWCPEADQTSTLMCQISSENVHCVRLPVAKSHNFGQILTFGGLLYRPPITAESKSGVLQLTHTTRLRVKICFDRFILSPSGGEKP